MRSRYFGKMTSALHCLCEEHNWITCTILQVKWHGSCSAGPKDKEDLDTKFPLRKLLLIVPGWNSLPSNNAKKESDSNVIYDKSKSYSTFSFSISVSNFMMSNQLSGILIIIIINIYLFLSLKSVSIQSICVIKHHIIIQWITATVQEKEGTHYKTW